MKISKVALLAMSGIFTLASLGLMFLSVSANGSDPEDHRVQLYFDPNNAVQHFQGVKIIATEVNDDSNATIKKSGGLVGIDTDYNFILSGGNIKDNSITKGVRRSSILGGKNNNIEKGQNETILGGESNIIIQGDSNSILGGSDNTLRSGEDSVIFGGSENEITGNYSSIIGGEGNKVTKGYAIAIGNNNGSDGYNSVAMGSGSKVSGKHSFLWTDGSSSSNLSRDNVFVVKGTNGMVINTNKAHDLAQLTVGGPLIIYRADDDPSSGQCNNNTKGVVKLVDNDDNKKCLCSCDGSGRNALHDGVMCPFKCSGIDPKPVSCGTGDRDCDTDPYTYTGTCINGTVVQGTGAFFVSTKKDGSTFVNYINWSCQSETGYVRMCSGVLDDQWCSNKHPQTNGECMGPDPSNAKLVIGIGDFGSNVEKRVYMDDEEAQKYPCSYVCKEGFFRKNSKECVECPNGYDTGNKICIGGRTCKNIPNTYLKYDEEDHKWNCVDYDGVCLYKKQNSGPFDYISEYTNGGWMGSIIENSIWILRPIRGTGRMQCVDDDQYAAVYMQNSCMYKCRNGKYCRNAVNDSNSIPILTCTTPSCNWNGYAYSGSEKNSMYTGGHAGHYTFTGMMTPEQIAYYFEHGMISNTGYYGGKYNTSLSEADVNYIKEKLGKSDTGDIVNYLKNLTVEQFKDLFGETDETGFARCVYWCPEENRSYTGTNGKIRSGTNYYCLSTGTKADFHPQRNCPPARFFGYSTGIRFNANATRYGETWEYVSWNNTSTTGCKWSCATGYIPVDGWTPYYNSYTSYTSLFGANSVYKTCYKPCDPGLWLSHVTTNGRSVASNDAGGVFSCNICTGDSNVSRLRESSNIISATGGTFNFAEYRGCSCEIAYTSRDKNSGQCKCSSDKTRNSAHTACVCGGDMEWSGSLCVCPGGSVQGSNYKCVCKGVNEVFSGGARTCNCQNGYYRDSAGICVTSAECNEASGSVEMKCENGSNYCRDSTLTGFLFDPVSCGQIPKKAKLELSIQNVDLQGNTKIYQVGSGITYKVTITNTGNLKIKNITGISYVLSGNEEREPNIGLKHLAGLSGGASSEYTLTYKLTGEDFKGLKSAGQTGNFTIKVTATGIVMDDRDTIDLVVHPATLTVTIKKTRN